MIETEQQVEPDEQEVRKPRRFPGPVARRRMLRSIALLPSLCTIGNALAGFGAIHFATKDALGKASQHNLSIAAWMILIAMVFDMLDGRLARMARKTSDFGAQLDSLCDVVSFGVAPAVIMLRTVIMVMLEPEFVWYTINVERAVWAIAAVYLACAALRLARFNVENEPDEAAHMKFEGLPSPGAAATVMASVLLLTHDYWSWLENEWMSITVGVSLPIITLVAALLMVSKIEYPHIVNQYIRGRRSFTYLVAAVIILTLGVLKPFVFGAVLAIGYMLLGPVTAIFKKGATKEEPSED